MGRGGIGIGVRAGGRVGLGVGVGLIINWYHDLTAQKLVQKNTLFNCTKLLVLHVMMHYHPCNLNKSRGNKMKRTKKMLDGIRRDSRDQVIQKIRSLENDLKNKGATTSIPLDLLIQMLEYWSSQDDEERGENPFFVFKSQAHERN